LFGGGMGGENWGGVERDEESLVRLDDEFLEKSYVHAYPVRREGKGKKKKCTSPASISLNQIINRKKGGEKGETSRFFSLQEKGRNVYEKEASSLSCEKTGGKGKGERHYRDGKT